jgi:hypothetical protein
VSWHSPRSVFFKLFSRVLLSQYTRTTVTIYTYHCHNIHVPVTIYTYHCHNIHLPLSQYTRTTVIIYTYHYHNIHVPLSQYTRTTVTIYTYHCHNIHVPLSQYMYHCHNIHVPLSQYKICSLRIPLGTANFNAYLQNTGLPGCFAGLQVSGLQTCQLAKQQRCENLKFRTCYFSNLMH